MPSIGTLKIRTHSTPPHIDTIALIKKFFKKWFPIHRHIFPLLFADSPVFSRKRSTSKTIYSSIDSNREITLNCVFEGYPVPRVRFKRMGVELNNSGISYEAGSASYNFFVKSENDFGFYTCEATNDRGSANHFIEVYKPGMST